ETEPPTDVDDAVSAQAHAHREDGEHQGGQDGRAHGQVEQESGGVDHARVPAWSGRRSRIWSTPMRPSSKARAPPARYRRHMRARSGPARAVNSSKRVSNVSSQARAVRT